MFHDFREEECTSPSNMPEDSAQAQETTHTTWSQWLAGFFKKSAPPYVAVSDVTPDLEQQSESAPSAMPLTKGQKIGETLATLGASSEMAQSVLGGVQYFGVHQMKELLSTKFAPIFALVSLGSAARGVQSYFFERKATVGWWRELFGELTSNERNIELSNAVNLILGWINLSGSVAYASITFAGYLAIWDGLLVLAIILSLNDCIQVFATDGSYLREGYHDVQEYLSLKFKKNSKKEVDQSSLPDPEKASPEGEAQALLADPEKTPTNAAPIGIGYDILYHLLFWVGSPIAISGELGLAHLSMETIKEIIEHFFETEIPVPLFYAVLINCLASRFLQDMSMDGASLAEGGTQFVKDFIDRVRGRTCFKLTSTNVLSGGLNLFAGAIGTVSAYAGNKILGDRYISGYPLLKTVFSIGSAGLKGLQNLTTEGPKLTEGIEGLRHRAKP